MTFHFEHVYPPMNPDASLPAFTPNIRLPVSDVPFQVMPNRDRDCLVFTKLRPFEDWGNFNWTARVGSYGDHQDVQVQMPFIPEQIQPKEVVDEPMIEEVMTHLECGTCTFHNDLAAQRCEMCDTPLK